MFLRTWLRRAVHGAIWSPSVLFLLPLLLAGSLAFVPVPVTDINPGGSAFPDYLTAAGDSVYFYADTGGTKQVFVANQRGATQLTSLPGGAGTIDNIDYKAPIQAAGSTVYFLVDADDNWSVDEIWRTDGTPAGTQLVLRKEIASFQAAADGFYVVASDGSGDWGIWYGDGSVGSAKLLQGGFDPLTTTVYDLGMFDGDFYFAVSKPMSSAMDLWRAGPDGATLLGSTTLRDWVNSAVYQNTLYIADRSGEVWRIPAGSDTPVMWQDGSAFYGYVMSMQPIGDRLYLIDWDLSTYTQTLWRYDGTADKPEIIVTHTKIYALAGLQDNLYFAAEQFTDDGMGQKGSLFLRLPLTTTTPSSVSPLFQIPGDYRVGGLKSDGDLLYMQVYTQDGTQLWVSDGSDADPQRVTTLVTDYNNWGAQACPCVAIAAGAVYFDRQEAATGVELWTLKRADSGAPLYLPYVAH